VTDDVDELVDVDLVVAHWFAPVSGLTGAASARSTL
jgi:hypothetical protein